MNNRSNLAHDVCEQLSYLNLEDNRDSPRHSTILKGRINDLVGGLSRQAGEGKLPSVDDIGKSIERIVLASKIWNLKEDKRNKQQLNEISQRLWSALAADVLSGDLKRLSVEEKTEQQQAIIPPPGQPPSSSSTQPPDFFRRNVNSIPKQGSKEKIMFKNGVKIPIPTTPNPSDDESSIISHGTKRDILTPHSETPFSKLPRLFEDSVVFSRRNSMEGSERPSDNPAEPSSEPPDLDDPESSFLPPYKPKPGYHRQQSNEPYPSSPTRGSIRTRADIEEASGERKRAKHRVKCKHWPRCPYGSSCWYYHPDTVCPYFPNCRKGDECEFIHMHVHPTKVLRYNTF